MNISREFKIGLFIVFFLTFIAIISPLLPLKNLNDFGEMLSPPSKEHIFGTDSLGRDVFAMVILGTRASLFVGIIATIISFIIGIFIGAFSGYFGGKIDQVINEILNIFSMIPTLFLIILVISIFGSGISRIAIVIGLTGWVGTARIMRAQTRSLKERTFIKALITTGESDFKIIFKHIIPHGISPILVNVAITVSSAILSEAGLSFIGLGDANVISWGKVINLGKNYLLSGPWIMIFPGIALSITIYGFHMIGEGLNKYFEDD